MAKKTTTAKKKTAKKSPSSDSAAKTVRKKPATSKTSPSKKRAAKKPAKTQAPSVDSLLKKYEVERKTKQAALVQARKQIVDSEQKVSKLQDQIVKLKSQAESTEKDINELDSRRDAEISEVLLKLGVQLTGSTANDNKPSDKESDDRQPDLFVESTTAESPQDDSDLVD